MSTGLNTGLAEDQSWVLRPLLEVVGVRHAVVLTSDGLVAGVSPGLPREAGEGASAMMSSLIGAARNVARELSQNPDAAVVQVVVAVNEGFVFAVPAGRNAMLALYADGSTDMQRIAHLVQVQVAMLGDKAMGAQARQARHPGP